MREVTVGNRTVWGAENTPQNLVPSLDALKQVCAHGGAPWSWVLVVSAVNSRCRNGRGNVLQEWQIWDNSALA